MYTLGQFREITKELPDDLEIKIEAMFTPEKNGATETYEIITSRNTKEIILLPKEVYISDGKTALKVEQQAKE